MSRMEPYDELRLNTEFAGFQETDNKKVSENAFLYLRYSRQKFY